MKQNEFTTLSAIQIITFNPNDIKRIMATDFHLWEKGELLPAALCRRLC